MSAEDWSLTQRAFSEPEGGASYSSAQRRAIRAPLDVFLARESWLLFRPQKRVVAKRVEISPEAVAEKAAKIERERLQREAEQESAERTAAILERREQLARELYGVRLSFRRPRGGLSEQQETEIESRIAAEFPAVTIGTLIGGPAT